MFSHRRKPRTVYANKRARRSLVEAMNLRSGQHGGTETPTWPIDIRAEEFMRLEDALSALEQRAAESSPPSPAKRRLARLSGDPSEGRTIPASEVISHLKSAQASLADRNQQISNRIRGLEQLDPVGHALALQIFHAHTNRYLGDQTGPDLDSEPLTGSNGDLGGGEFIAVLIDQQAEAGTYCAAGLTSPEGDVTLWFLTWQPVASLVGSRIPLQGLALHQLLHAESRRQ